MNNVKTPREDAAALQSILIQHEHERVAILGEPGVGKSTLQQLIAGTLDMDDILFHQLGAEEKEFVFQKPWIPAVGIEMKRLARKWIKVLPGAPVFATVLLDVDFIICLQIDDVSLRRRIESRTERQQSFELSKGVQKQLESDIRESGIPHVRFILGESQNH